MLWRGCRSLYCWSKPATKRVGAKCVTGYGGCVWSELCMRRGCAEGGAQRTICVE